MAKSKIEPAGDTDLGAEKISGKKSAPKKGRKKGMSKKRC
jgi:hypothetical protein